MKYLYFLSTVIFLLTTANTFSQKFAPLGAEWHYNKGNGNVPPNSEYYHYKVTKDTLYAGKNARKIEREYFRYAGDNVPLTPMYVFDKNDSVFYYNDLHQRYLLLYDFTANTGDTLFFTIPDTTAHDSIFREVVDSIRFTSVNGKSLKKIHTSALDNYSFFGGYTEYIGSELLMLPQWGLIPYLYGPIRCYQDSAIFIQFSTQNCKHRLITSLEENRFFSENIKIRPNPVDEYATIELQRVTIDKIKLMDLQGKLVKEFSAKSKGLDFSKIENGVYFIQITTEDQKQYSQKLIVHH